MSTNVVGSNQQINIKVNALGTSSSASQTYKTKIIKPNIVDGVNTLNQDMIADSDTKYVIKYDFTLGEDITVPENCILEFDGGGLYGTYSLIGNKTSIIASIINIFSTDVNIIGSWNIENVYPEWFGAKGDSINDDSSFFLKSMKYCTIASCPLKLTGKYYINTAIEVNFGNSLVIYGSKNIPTTLIKENKNSFSNIIFGVNGNITIDGVQNITFNNVGFNGINDGIILKSFRNKIINCGFNGFKNAIRFEEGKNWTGENQILYCVFNSVTNCIVLNNGSDSDIDGCLVDSTCTTFISGGFDSGFKIQNNHDYSSDGSVIKGYFTNITGNYFDGFNKLVITGNSKSTITNNSFVGNTKKFDKCWCIKFTSDVTLYNLITGNAVNHTNTDASIDNLYFINLDDITYFNRNRISDNQLTDCKIFTNLPSGAISYNNIGHCHCDSKFVDNYHPNIAEISKCSIHISNGTMHGYIKYTINSALPYADCLHLGNSTAWSNGTVAIMKVSSRPNEIFTSIISNKIAMPVDYAMPNVLEVYLMGISEVIYDNAF